MTAREKESRNHDKTTKQRLKIIHTVTHLWQKITTLIKMREPISRNFTAETNMSPLIFICMLMCCASLSYVRLKMFWQKFFEAWVFDMTRLIVLSLTFTFVLLSYSLSLYCPFCYFHLKKELLQTFHIEF